MSDNPSFKYESEFWQLQDSLVVGVDEVGRGCLAGPVVTAAVAFSPHASPIFGVNDSKLLSALQRQKLVSPILEQAIYWNLGISSVNHINENGIVASIQAAVDSALSQLKLPYRLLIDGPTVPLLRFTKPLSIKPIIGGDKLSCSIAAASILAKVFRDALMQNLSSDYNHYDWHHNKGYGTPAHLKAIKTYGPTIFHRNKYLRKII